MSNSQGPDDQIFAAFHGFETYKNSVQQELMMVNALLRWFGANARDLPWRRTLDPYAIWISEVMLQQTQVKTVIPYWEQWMNRFPGVKELAVASTSQVLKQWEGLGYYSRARQLHQAAETIVTGHGGVFPSAFDSILALPGIGRYTAGAICSIAFNQPAAILDGNVIRVLTRIHGIAGNPRQKETNTRLWKHAESLVTCAAKTRASKGRNCSELNQALMELGALICTPRNPACEKCPLRKFCRARLDGRQHELPHASPRPTTTPRRFVAFVVGCGGRFLVRQRPDGVHNARLWEFPNREVNSDGTGGKSGAIGAGSPPDDSMDQWLRKYVGQSVKKLESFCTVKHSITRYRITIEVYRGTMTRLRPIPPGCQWRRIVELETLAFPSAHRRILTRLRDEEAGL